MTPRGGDAHPSHHHAGPPRRPLPAAAELDHSARILSALGDAERLRLLHLLVEGERCVSDLVDLTGARTTTVSQRLRVLREHRLVTSRRDGKHVYYRLADDHVAELLETAIAHAGEIG